MEQTKAISTKPPQGHVPLAQPMNKVRLTLSASHKVDNMNFVSAKIIEEAKKSNLKIKGPIRLPVKKLSIATRKTPCGEGSKTWDHYRMEIHKWIFDLFCSSEDIKKVISFQVGTNVSIDVTATVTKKFKGGLNPTKEDVEVDESKIAAE